MDLAALDYELDPTLIAQRPLPARDGGRLVVVARAQGVCAHSPCATSVTGSCLVICWS